MSAENRKSQRQLPDSTVLQSSHHPSVNESSRGTASANSANSLLYTLESPESLRASLRELRDLSALRAAMFIVRRALIGLVVSLRLKVSGAKFSFNGRELGYFTVLDALLVPTEIPLARRIPTLLWKATSERIVEIRIAREMLPRDPGGNLLEIGDTLAYYMAPTRRVIVDKYQTGPRITQMDVDDFHPPGRFDAIIAISTLEHVGFDELPQDPHKFSRCLNLLTSLLREDGGMLLVTLPVGYNPAVDLALVDGSMSDFELTYMVESRTSPPEWMTASETAARLAETALVVGVYRSTSVNGNKTKQAGGRRPATDVPPLTSDSSGHECGAEHTD